MLVAAELKHVLGALDNDARMDTERKQELEKKNKEMLDKMQDDLDRKFEDVVKKGVSGDDVTKAVGKLEKDLDDIQRRTQIR
jgi:predicted  nucleic acid-binding Zn-ribbon protein